VNINDLPEPGSPEFKKLLGEKSTGKKSVSQPASEAYKKNFDAIFGKQDLEKNEKKQGVIEPDLHTHKISQQIEIPQSMTEGSVGPFCDAESLGSFKKEYEKYWKEMGEWMFKDQLQGDWPNGAGSSDYDAYPGLTKNVFDKSNDNLWNSSIEKSGVFDKIKQWQITKKKADEMANTFFPKLTSPTELYKAYQEKAGHLLANVDWAGPSKSFGIHCLIHDNETLIGKRETVTIGDITFQSQFHVCWACEDEKHRCSIERTQA